MLMSHDNIIIAHIHIFVNTYNTYSYFTLDFLSPNIYNINMVGLAQMVRASDCGPEGRRFDPDIPPHAPALGICYELGTEASQGANGSILISHPIFNNLRV